MPRLTAVLLTLAVLISLAACANDAPPTFGEPPAQRRTQPQPSAPTTHRQPVAQSDEQPEPEPPNGGSLIMQLSEPLDVYQWIGGFWLRDRSFGPRTRLLVDGWLEQDHGVIWLHLDLNGVPDGWARLDQSPLRPAALQALPQLPAPTLPAAQLLTPDGRRFAIRLLGRAAHETSFAVRFADSEPVFWVDRQHVASAQYPNWLPVYRGAVSGRWEPWREPPPNRLQLPVFGGNSRIAAWPGGPWSSWQLDNGEYPVLGRSFDAQWLAVRVDMLDPPIAWLPAAAQRLEFDLAALPIVLSAGLEAAALDANGGLRRLETAPQAWSRWEWRNERELLLSDSQAGSWIWDTEQDQLRPVSQRSLGNVSPDGAYAVDVVSPDPSAPPDVLDLFDTVLVSLEDGSETGFAAVHRPWPTDAPGFQQDWSADSRWLLSSVFQYGRSDQRTQHYALSTEGELVEIIPPPDTTIWDWSRLRALEQGGADLRYRNAAGEAIARPWSDEVYAVEPTDPRESSEPPALPEDWLFRGASRDGRLILASRVQETGAFDEHGLAALPWRARRGWGVYEFGVFDQRGELRQRFRAFGGLDCGGVAVTADWSPDGTRLTFGSRRTGCH